jgi:digeranylgeranylglycerophospholipid reductase
MKKEYDAIVIGAGPAGSTAGRFLAEGGASVLLVDRKREIGVPVRCGEGVGHEGLSRFVDPDQRWIASEINGARFITPRGIAVELDNVGRGYILERRLFDKALVALASEKGCEVAIDCNVKGIIRETGGTLAIRVQIRGERDQTIRTSLVIGADGIESWVGRWVGLRTHVDLHDMESCCQFSLDNVYIEKQYCEFYFGKEIAPGGYAWVFPKEDGLANVGLGIAADQHNGKRPFDYLTDFVRERFPTSSILSFSCGGVPVSPTLKRIYTDNVMLVGDAAHQVNPLSGGGIISSMEGGRLAALTGLKALKVGDFSRDFLKFYQEDWDRGYGQTHRKYYKIKEVISRTSDEKLNRAGEILQNIPREKLNLFTVFKTILLRHPALFTDLVSLFLRKK